MGAFIVVIGRKEETDVLPANQEVSGAALFEMDLKEGPGSVDRSTQVAAMGRGGGGKVLGSLAWMPWRCKVRSVSGAEAVPGGRVETKRVRALFCKPEGVFEGF